MYADSVEVLVGISRGDASSVVWGRAIIDDIGVKDAIFELRKSEHEDASRVCKDGE
jgi:hypothetical protein